MEHLERRLGLREAIALNMTDMIGVGPFLTLPLIVRAMGGPQAMLGWVLGALLAWCDGLIWAELGATYPRAGGSYEYLRQCFGPHKWGRLFSFLFVWQLGFSAPLVIASGCIGMVQYAAYLWPALQSPRPQVLAAIAACGLALWLCYRRIGWAGKVCDALWWGVLAILGWVVWAGLTHFHAAQVWNFPPGAWRLSGAWFGGLGAAMVIATYDYWGYENANFLGGEIERPERTLPRAILISIAVVAALYLMMNVGVLAVIPWREMMGGNAAIETHVVSVLMERVYGAAAARVATLLIVWAAFASVFSLLLGYSRVPWAAARDGNFFAAFGKLHPRLHIPHRSLLALALVTAGCCLFSLQAVITALVAVRLLLQCVLQAAGLWLLRCRRPAVARPYRMPLWPWPLGLALAGFIYMLVAGAPTAGPLLLATGILSAGTAIFLIRARMRTEWPFARAGA